MNSLVWVVSQRYFSPPPVKGEGLEAKHRLVGDVVA